MENAKGSKLYLFSIVLVAVLGGLLFGYDTAVISGAEKGLQAFFLGATDFQYTDTIHGLTSSSALIGCIIGSAISGLLASRWGRKKSLVFAGVCFFLSALGSYDPEFLFFPAGKPTYSLLLAFNFYRVLGGVGVGLASAICPMYIAEVAPTNIRGTLVSWNQFAIIFGQLVVYFVNFLILGSHTNPIIDTVKGVAAVMPGSDPWTVATGWRYMFGSEAFPAGLFTLLVCFVPETPRYLAMTGKDSRALAVLQHINGLEKAKEILADIKATAEVKTEKLFSFGWLVIFIGIMLSVFQQMVGINAVLYFAPRIFESMHMGNPMVQTVIMGVINILFTLVAIFTVEKWGRKPLLVTGSLGMAIGAIGVALTNLCNLPPIVSVVSIMFYSAAFMMSWGPICWVLIAEIFLILSEAVQWQ
jgi:SP family xylose:H+ symportor-like MFS transporter